MAHGLARGGAGPVTPIAIIAMKLPSLANSRLHWRERARVVKDQRTHVAFTLAGSPRPPTPCVIHLERHGVRLLDDDNLASAFKGVRDEVALWLAVDDKPGSGVEWRYAQHAGSTAQRVVISWTPSHRDEAPPFWEL